MRAEEPLVSKEGRYSAREACEALGICRNTLMAYTRKGLIRCGYRRGTLRRFYLGSEIRRLWAAIT